MYSAASVVNPSVIIEPVETCSEAIKYLYIPAIFIALYGLHRKRHLAPDAVLRFATHVSVFISLSGIPFVLGVLDPISAGGYELSLFGIDGRGFNGIFFHSHGAAITMGTSAIVLIWAAKRSNGLASSAFLVLLAIFALYCTFQTYARTGYAMAALGLLIVILLPFNVIRFMAIMPLAAVTIFFAAGAILDNEALLMRLQGQNIYTIASGSGGDLSSGRIRFWAAGIDSFWDSPPEEWLFGAGPYYGKERMLERVNLRISTHNSFFNALLYSGILGLGIFLTYTLSLVRMAWRGRRDHLAGNLVIALTGAYLAQLTLQGERAFLPELLLVLAIFSATIRSKSGLANKAHASTNQQGAV
ncbi:O-antigen ligase family protein [Rhodobacter sp. NSM]|uniref:O-antigen ligase family protein n=1 Tax=Rhodobacter sp. NSM TaxID=3457501 RepID=UPI003FD39FCE